MGELSERASAVTYAFGSFRLDPAERRLSRDGEDLRLPPKVFDTLVYLVEHRGMLVEKDDLMKAIWPDMFVEEVTLARNISLLRKALGDAAGQDQSEYIETVSKRGYRFIAEVRQGEELKPSPDETPAVALTAPRRRSIRRSWMIGSAVAILLLGAGALWRYQTSRRVALEIHSLAVLPLENLSSNPEQEYFADAMTDELITNLAQIHSLRVISRTSVMQFKHSTKNLTEIATELNVDAVIEGSVERVGNRVHITAQLLDARTDRHLWAATYEREMEDVLGLQTQVAREIADQVKANLTPGENARLAQSRRINPEAYDALLQGRFLRNRRAPAAMEKALEYFKRAVAIDPGSAESWTALGDCYASLGGDQSAVDPSTVRAQAHDALTKALELDPDLAEAHSSMGWYKMWFEWNASGAEREFQRGIELSPNDSNAHRYYAFYLRMRRRYDEALEQNRRAIDLSPLDILPQAHLMAIYAAQNEPDKVLEQANRVMEVDPNFTGVNIWMARVFEIRHQWPQAYASLERIKDTYKTEYLRGIADVAGSSGDMHRSKAAMAELNQYAREHYVSPIVFASYEARFGSREKAFEWLEMGYRERAADLICLQTSSDDMLEHPTIAFSGTSTQSDPRFRDLIRRVGFQ